MMTFFLFCYIMSLGDNMKIIKKKIDICLNIADYFVHLQNSDVLLFDIETTGFVAEKSILYLIGCAYYTDNSWISVQFFAEKKSDEAEILKAFFELCKSRRYTISFNGETFDIPFIIKKSRALGISCTYFDSLISVDMYKLVKKYKSFLGLENLKQKTLEKFLGIDRKDLYSGGDLIEVFHQYLSTKTPLLEYSLLLHNEEDVLGMLELVKLMNYVNFLNQLLEISSTSINTIEMKENMLSISLSLGINSPFEKVFIINSWTLIFKKDSNLVILAIRTIEETLYHYFKDYKNYYYSIEKDEAIHKSIGKYLDATKRLPATSDNCYIKKNGMFFETYTVHESIPLFKTSRSSKVNYIPVKSDDIHKEIICESLRKILSK